MKKFFGGKKNRLESAKAKKGGPATKPGAVSDDGTSSFRVMVPEGVQPGQEFQVYAGSRIVRVRCPQNTKSGQYLQINVPVDKNLNDKKNPAPSPDLPPDSPNVTKLERIGNAPQAYMVEIPDGVRGGQRFPVMIAGQQLMVDCPLHARPGSQVRIVPPPPPADEQSPRSAPQRQKSRDDGETQLFEVMVPPGVKPGKPFALLAGGVRVLVTCPVNANPGQRIRFKLPLALTQKPKTTSEAAQIKLSYDKDGWTRTIRASDMKFQ